MLVGALKGGGGRRDAVRRGDLGLHHRLLLLQQATAILQRHDRRWGRGVAPGSGRRPPSLVDCGQLAELLLDRRQAPPGVGLPRRQSDPLVLRAGPRLRGRWRGQGLGYERAVGVDHRAGRRHHRGDPDGRYETAGQPQCHRCPTSGVGRDIRRRGSTSGATPPGQDACLVGGGIVDERLSSSRRGQIGRGGFGNSPLLVALPPCGRAMGGAAVSARRTTVCGRFHHDVASRQLTTTGLGHRNSTLRTDAGFGICASATASTCEAATPQHRTLAQGTAAIPNCAHRYREQSVLA